MPSHRPPSGPAPLRRLLRALRSSAWAALMLALALGTLLALFSLFDQVVLRPQPGAAGLVTVAMASVEAEGHANTRGPSPLELRDVPDFPWLVGRPVQQDVKYLRVEAAGGTRSALVAYASPEFFTVLGLQPAYGRLFAAGDPEPGAVLSWSAWQRLGDTLGLGAPLTVDGVDLPLLGVLPPDFTGFAPGYEPEVWVTLEARARSGAREARFLADRAIGLPTFGRLRPGVTPAQAEAALAPVVAQWRRQLTPMPRSLAPRVRPVSELRREAWAHFLPGARLLWIATALLILIATLNLGNLEVARWIKERGDWATRVALGAGPGRLVLELGRPMLGTLLLGALGALPIAWLLTHLISRFPAPSEFPVALRPELHGHVFLLALALVALLALPLALLAWAWFLRHAVRVTAYAPGGLRWRKALLGAQVALSVMLLCGTLNALSALRRAQNTPLGFDPRGVQAFSFAFPTHTPGGREAIRDGWTRLCEHFQAAPRVQASTVLLPPCEAYEPTPQPWRTASGQQCQVLVQRIYPGTFQLLRIPLLLGRDFQVTDNPEAPVVAVISAPLARQLWPGQSPLGQILEDDQGRRSQVVGVVADHYWEGLNKAVPHTGLVFLSGRQRFGPLQTLLLRSELPPAQLYPWVEREVALLDPRLAIQRAEPLTGRVERMLQPQRLAATLFGMMGAAALVLSLLGLYALQQYLTLQRLQEAGVRMALGATPGRVRIEFLGSLAWPLGVGLGAGLLGTVAGWRLLGSAVAGLPPLEPLTLVVVCLGLLASGVLAGALPLRGLERATPAELLRD